MTAHDRSLASLASLDFRALHRGPRPLLLPNAWDHASGAALAAEGFPAVGTTSLGVAAAAGKPDAHGATRTETLALARGLARLPVAVSADIESGFGGGPDDIAALAADLNAAGVAGINIEDGRADGTLADIVVHARVIAAIKAAAPDLFVNARTDAYWLGGGADPLTETLRRSEAYAAAGADGVFVPSLPDDAAIAAVVARIEVPLNVLFAPDRHSYARLADLGVARISCGSLLFRAALHATVAAARAITAESPEAVGEIAARIPSYAAAAALADAFA